MWRIQHRVGKSFWVKFLVWIPNTWLWRFKFFQWTDILKKDLRLQFSRCVWKQKDFFILNFVLRVLVIFLYSRILDNLYIDICIYSDMNYHKHLREHGIQHCQCETWSDLYESGFMKTFHWSRLLRYCFLGI